MAELQDAVKHTESSTVAEAVWSSVPKSRPTSVSDACPLKGEFKCIADRTGPSKVKAFVLVPIPAPTVSIAALRAVSAEPPVQTRDEADVQELVRQKISLVEALSVKS